MSRESKALLKLAGTVIAVVATVLIVMIATNGCNPIGV